MSDTFEDARVAVFTDLPAIKQLIGAAGSEASQKRGGQLLTDRELAAHGDRIRNRLAQAERQTDRPDDIDIVVGEFDGSVLGVGVVVYEPLASGAILARLLAFVVDEEARGVGIGEAMMDQVKVLARSRGCRSLDAYALPGDRNTKNFFESFGMKARLLTVNDEL